MKISDVDLGCLTIKYFLAVSCVVVWAVIYAFSRNKITKKSECVYYGIANMSEFLFKKTPSRKTEALRLKSVEIFEPGSSGL